MKPSSTDPVVPRQRTAAGTDTHPAGTDTHPAEGHAGKALADSCSAATEDADVRVVRFDRPLRTGADAIGWADPRIRQRIDQATTEAREQAHSLGYAAGWAQGRRASAEQAKVDEVERAAAWTRELHEQRARLQALLQTLGEVTRKVTVAAVPAWTEVADAIADGALAIARAALGRELAAVDAEVADAVRTALRSLAGAEDVTVHVHPDDLSLLRELVGEQLPAHVRVDADPGVPRGGVLAQTPVQRLYRDLPAAIAQAEEVLRS